MTNEHSAVLSEVSKHLTRLRSAPKFFLFEQIYCAAAIRGERIFPGTLCLPVVSERDLRELEVNLLERLHATQEFMLEDGVFYVVFELQTDSAPNTDVRLQSIFFSDLGAITELMSKVEAGFRAGMFDKNGELMAACN